MLATQKWVFDWVMYEHVSILAHTLNFSFFFFKKKNDIGTWQNNMFTLPDIKDRTYI